MKTLFFNSNRRRETKNHSLVRAVSWMLGHRVVNGAIAFSIGVIVGRELGPEAFGLYSFFIVVLIVGMELAGSEGLNTGLVHFVSSTQNQDPHLARGYLKTALKAKALAAIGLLLLAAVTVPLVLPFLSAGEDLWMPLLFGLAGASLASIWRATLGNLQARRHFAQYALLSLTPNVVRLAAFLCLILAGQLTLFSTLATSILGFTVGLFIGIWYLPWETLKTRSSKRQMSAFLDYSKWTVVYSLLQVVYHRFDILVLGVLVLPAALGLYAAAAMLAGVVYILYEAVLAVLIPNASRLKTAKELQHFMVRSLKLTSILSLPIVAVMILAEPIIVTLFTDAYSEAVPIARILCAGLIFTVLLEPLSAIILARRKPHVLAKITAIVLLGYSVSLVLLFPNFGIAGVAWASVAARMLSGVLFLYAVRRELSTT